MPRSLLLFVMAPGIGAYVNAMASAVNSFDVSNIVLVNVDGSQSGEQIDFSDFAGRILRDTISGLINGVYKDVIPSRKTYRETQVPDAINCEAYKKIGSILTSSYHIETVNYDFLRDDIGRLKSKYGSDIIVDISGATKRLGIDILTACLAIDISNVTLFELKIPARGVESLYHKLLPSDFQHLILPNWKPLIGNIEFFSVQQNKKKLIGVVTSIIASVVLVVAQNLVQEKFGINNSLSWLLIVAIAVIGLVGGVSPIVDAWGGLARLRKTK